MAGQDDARALLEGAYGLATPADNIAYYRHEAAAYDNFITSLGYVFPGKVAQILKAAFRDGDLPVADIGCGTGAVAEALDLPPADIDGFDISPEMLARARAKALYGRLVECDLTRPLAGIAPVYGALVSSGTFTHGHLGPEPIRHLLAIARPGALFVLGVNAAHYAARGFGAALSAMLDQRLISAPSLTEVPIYDIAGHAHSGDTAMILTFRKA
jgi:SAM-dependent methyltransferase